MAFGTVGSGGNEGISAPNLRNLLGENLLVRVVLHQLQEDPRQSRSQAAAQAARCRARHVPILPEGEKPHRQQVSGGCRQHPEPELAFRWVGLEQLEVVVPGKVAGPRSFSQSGEAPVRPRPPAGLSLPPRGPG